MVETAKPEAALMMPQQALQIDQTGRYVLKVDGRTRCRCSRVTGRRQADGCWSSTTGLQAGERVITEGLQKVRPGMVVDARPTAGRAGLAMLSSVFIDRPRLAIVISVVITIAGADRASRRMPIAQFPDIVPPQVQVTARYPGAGAAVVEQTVAQPIESQVVGVDKMLYMKSTSGNDGSYTLTVSFAVGTDPDINTVNVQNRVSLAEAKLPEEVKRARASA